VLPEVARAASVAPLTPQSGLAAEALRLVARRYLERFMVQTTTLS